MKNIVSYQDLDLIDLLYLYFLFALEIRRVFSTNQESILLSSYHQKRELSEHISH